MSPAVDRLQSGAFRLEVARRPGADRERRELELAAAGVELPLVHRALWAELGSGAESWLVLLRDLTGRARAGFAIEAQPSRALPGHRLLRVQRFGHGLDRDAVASAVGGLAALARSRPRILRLRLEVLSPDDRLRAAIAESARAAGFEPDPHPRSYERTIVLDLRRDEAALLAALHKTARQNIREIGKHPLAVVELTSERYARRMSALVSETMGRTGGEDRRHDWKAILGLSARRPELSRLAGLVRTDADGPEALVAFAWGQAQGDHVEYSVAASTRVTGSRVSLGYALAWDLILWAKRCGAGWFDFGGVTAGTAGSGDPLGGISDFKRRFGGEVAKVGEEWQLEPHPLRARVAGTVGAVARVAGMKRMNRAKENPE
jgi:hypothetical protein